MGRPSPLFATMNAVDQRQDSGTDLDPAIPPRPEFPRVPRSPLQSPIDLLRQQSRRLRLSYGLARSQAEGREPVLVYAHPRTGSMSLVAALDRSDGVVPFHVHTIRRDHTFWRSDGPIAAEDGVVCGTVCRAAIARSLLARGRVRMVVPVREPVAVNISFFLYWMHRWWAPLEWDGVDGLSDAQLARLFLDRYPHHSSTRWIEREFSAATGLSLGGNAFDRDRGAVTLANDRVTAIVLRSDLPGEVRTREISEFLGRTVTAIRTENSSEQVLPGRGGLIARTHRVVAGIPGYVDMLLGTEHTQRFWTADRIDGFRRKWRAVAAGDDPNRTA